MGRTVARYKKEIAQALSKLPEILQDVGICCNISIDTSGKFLSVTISIKTENMKEWVPIVKSLEDKTPLVKCWRSITAELVSAFIVISKTPLSATLSPGSKTDYFTVGVYCDRKGKLISWVVYPKPEYIEVEESWLGKEVLSWEEYLRKLVYTIRLIMEVGEDV
jgi:hypothetical protein